MSMWYWLLWVVLTALNGVLLLVGTRTLHKTRELIDSHTCGVDDDDHK